MAEERGPRKNMGSHRGSLMAHNVRGNSGAKNKLRNNCTLHLLSFFEKNSFASSTQKYFVVGVLQSDPKLPAKKNKIMTIILGFLHRARGAKVTAD